MKNILLIADYLKLDNWGMLAYSYLDALRHSPDINLVARRIEFSGPKRECPEWLPPLESKTEEKYDVILQCCPPNLYNFGPGYQGIFINETLYLSNKDWVRRLKLLPIIVSSPQEKAQLEARDPSIQIQLVPPYIDSSFLYHIYPLPNISAKIKDYKFYWVGDYGNRSNYQDVYRAYMAEFSSRDDVHLTMYFVDNPNGQLAQIIGEELNDLKKSVGRKIFPRESIIVGGSLNEIRSLHAHCDCIVELPHSLGYSIHVLESMFFGSGAITSGEYQYDYMDPWPSFIYSDTRPIFNSPHYDCLSLWKYPIFDYVRDEMRNRFANDMRHKYNLTNHNLENVLEGFKDL